MIQRLLKFLDASPVNFLAVSAIADVLKQNGYTHFDAAESLNGLKAGDNIFVLPAAVDGKSTIYICRTSSNNWNGFVDTITTTIYTSIEQMASELQDDRRLHLEKYCCWRLMDYGKLLACFS